MGVDLVNATVGLETLAEDREQLQRPSCANG